MNELIKIYPWQLQVWQHLNQDSQRMPHALLMYGRAGIGKYDFARHFSQSLLCSNQGERGHACGSCASCNWFNDNSHPDFRLLSPEQESDAEDEGLVDRKSVV